MTLGPYGDLWATENFPDKILEFNPYTDRGKEYALPNGILVHDSTLGPHNTLWFTTLTSKVGFLDPASGRITYVSGITPGAEPHAVLWDDHGDGDMYVTEQLAGKIDRINPVTSRVTQMTAGLPPGNWIHNITQMPNGDLWAVLQHSDELARFNVRTQIFDRFVKIPVPNAGPRDITYVASQNALFATLYAANKLAEYNLSTGRLSIYGSPFKAISLKEADGRTTVPKLTFVRADADQKYLWIATLGGGELLRFSLATHRIKQVYCGIGFPSATLGLANDTRGRMWFAEALPGALGRIEP
jgi:streptogramin lyase